MTLRGFTTALSVTGLVCLAHTAQAENVLQVFKPYASAGLSYDSNLFRLQDQRQAEAQLGNDNLSDWFTTIEAGLDGEFDVSKQNFIVKGKIYRNTYDQYSNVDYTGAMADVIWNWQIAERWEGNLGYDFDRDLQDFANQRGDGKFVNIRERNNFYGRADYYLTRSWKVYGRAKATFIDFSAQTASLLSLDTDRTTVGAGVDYISRIGNRIGVDAEFVEGKYEDLSALDFDEYNVGPTANWKVSEKTRVRGRLVYTNRDYTDSEAELIDFDGVTGRITLVRNPSEPTNWEAAIYREISTFNDDIATYAVVDGVSFEPAWQIGGKTTLNFLVGYEIRDFKGGNTSVDPDPNNPDLDREDKVATAQFSVDWEATDYFTLSFGITGEERSSNREPEDYEFLLTEVRIKGGF